MKRRDFFKSAGLGAVAGLGFPGESVSRAQSASIKQYGSLGSTGLKIGDILFGCGDCENKCPARDHAAIRVTSVGETRSKTNRMILEK